MVILRRSSSGMVSLLPEILHLLLERFGGIDRCLPRSPGESDAIRCARRDKRPRVCTWERMIAKGDRDHERMFSLVVMTTVSRADDHKGRKAKGRAPFLDMNDGMGGEEEEVMET